MTPQPTPNGATRFADDEPGRDAPGAVLDAYFDSAAELLMLYRPGDDRYRFSASWERVLGWTRDEIRGLPSPLDLVHPDDVWTTAQGLVALIEDHTPIEGYEHRLRTASGDYRRFEWNAQWLDDSQLVMATARDVTETRTALDTARRAANRLRNAFEELPVGTFVTSVRPEDFGRFLRVNVAFCELTGYRADELLTMHHRDLLVPDDVAKPGVGEAERQVVAGRNRGGQYEVRHVRKDGTEIWVRLTASIIERDGRPHHAVAYAEDVTEARQAIAELARRALFDELTGLANRHRFMDHLRLGIDKLNRSSASLALVYIDLDRFKEVNDSAGHESGDAVLAQIGRRLSSVVRTVDTPARLAGDEFVVVCPDIDDPTDVVRIAERIATAMRAPVVLDGRSIDVGASVGVAVATSPNVSPAQLLHQADTAMYHAKARGGNRWELYNEHLQRRAVERVSVEKELVAALEERRFRLEYQPVVDLRSGTIVATEALLRLETPSGAVVPPAAFLDIAEGSRLIGDIADWVLTEACRQAAEWNRRFGPIRMAVNVSPRQLPSIRRGKLEAALRSAGLDPAALTLELPERLLIDLNDVDLTELRDAAALGVHLSVDDFGTGSGSINALQRVPVDEVKIDRTLIATLVDGGDRRVVEAVAATARTLDLDLVAEGVESAAQVEQLRSLACSLGQGYHLHRPAPAAAVTALLEQQAQPRG